MKEIVILKLGGSIVTDKTGDCRIDHDRLNEISGIIAEKTDISVILVHGAGSCGHPEAKQHQLDIGLQPIYKSGIFITHRAVRRLNDAVVNALRSRGVEAVGVHPLSACTAENGRIISFDAMPVELLARQGIVPVLHGDVVMDTVRGACIISGDQLVSYLPRVIRVGRIGLATDVAGVRIDTVSADQVKIGGSDNTDVTGGMKGKIRELLALAESGTESNIFHISRLSDFLDGRDHGGTVVTR
jgi:isopentenyl phosphate kinase